MTDPYGDWRSNLHFALIGAAGYIAPRHLCAIKETWNILTAALDISDSVGVLDQYFPDAQFFTREHEFKQYLAAHPVDYVSICSPNYLHKSHIELALSTGASVICEKPLVTTVQALHDILAIEARSPGRVYTVLQLRAHPAIVALKAELARAGNSGGQKYPVRLKYITPRGRWYAQSWKGNAALSGGILFNIGVHFFDILLYLFGAVEGYTVEQFQKTKARGTLELQQATVQWELSVDAKDLPADHRGFRRPYRRFQVADREIDLDVFFTNLHTEVYRRILQDGQFAVSDTQAVVTLLAELARYATAT
jgi:UDP-N-acetyl-2-amino-2-deoxyglucuronate dehydrogenase